MANIDVVARLQLRAEQFSSETGARFAEMKTRAQSAAQDVRSSFGGAFAEVQKLAQTALVIPRSAAGSLDLSSEITSLNAAATATEQRATALRELSVAQAAAASASGVDAQAMRLEADAAAVASLAEERNATAIRGRIVALEAVQGELNRTVTATGAMNAAGARHIASAGQQRQSTMMLGQQLQDFSVQVSSGQSAVTAFSQQIGQAAFALNGMGGSMGAVGAFLSSGWGTAVLIGLTVVGPLVSKLMEGDDAAKKLGASTLDFSRVLETKITSVSQYKDVIEQLNKATKGLIDTQAILIDNTVTNSRNLVADADRKIADLDKRIADIRKNRKYELPNPVQLVTGDRTPDIAQSAELAKLTADRQSLASDRLKNSQSVLEAEVALTKRSVAETSDKAAALEGQFKRATARLDEKRLASGRIDSEISAGLVPMGALGRAVRIISATRNTSVS